MIGVICSDDELIAAEEFFQLFKTPWQRLQEGKRYDVVVATEGSMPRVSPGLLVAYGSRKRDIDSTLGVSDISPAGRSAWHYRGVDLPIYGDGVAFAMSATCRSVIQTQSRATGYRANAASGMEVVRLGYDLFSEVGVLLSEGQPSHWARVPTIEIHIAVLRDAIVGTGMPLLEIPPVPAGKSFSVCLTHDIDFVGIKQHRLDHTMWGFLYRSTLGGLRDCLRGRISIARLLRMWWAVVVLPFVYLGWAKDFWLPFEWYMRVEKGLPVTYFFIPFKCRAGHGLGHANARRATKYDVTDIPEWISVLAAEGCEIAVHGIDAWHDVHAARSERARVADVAQAPVAGIRMHWLLRDAGTFEVLGEAGYSYDSTAGYNETVGYRLGTTQVCRPSRSPRLLELPLHIQDGALFYPGKLGLSEAEAWEICKELIGNAEKWGGVLTILWHDRSHGPERFWGDFYFRLIEELRRANPWFAKGSQAVDWFRKRRAIRFAEITTADGSDAIGLFCEEGTVEPAFSVRCWRGAIGTHTEEIERFHETPWSGLDPMMLPNSRGKSGPGGTRATHDIR